MVGHDATTTPQGFHDRARKTHGCSSEAVFPAANQRRSHFWCVRRASVVIVVSFLVPGLAYTLLIEQQPRSVANLAGRHPTHPLDGDRTMCPRSPCTPESVSSRVRSR